MKWRAEQDGGTWTVYDQDNEPVVMVEDERIAKLITAVADLLEAVQCAITTMDERGHRNLEGNSLMLFESEWDAMRTRLFQALEKA